MSADLFRMVVSPRRVKAARIEVEVFRHGVRPTRLVVQSADYPKGVVEIERHTRGAVVGQAGNLHALIGHSSTFRGESEQLHDSGSGEASKLPASATRTGPPTDEKYSGRVCALIWVAGIVVTWGAALWLIAWALA